jgi:hypothetical protein
MRYHVQRLTTGEWISRDFDLKGVSTTWALSGAGGISARIEPGTRRLVHSDGLRLLEPNATAIYAEEGDEIVAAGIVAEPKYDTATELEAPGFSSYPQGIPYPKATKFGRVDPLTIPRHIWDTVQSMPNGNIGVVVTGATATPSTSWIGNNAEPYGLVWWETPDCGSTIDDLAKSTPFDYVERHRWTSSAKTAVRHEWEIGYPRLGRQRDDLRFAGGENVTSSSPLASGPLVNEIIGIGRGEGAAMVHVRTSWVNGRLYRPLVITDKTATREQMERLVLMEQAKRSSVNDISEFTVVDHPNARISSIRPGDDVYLQDSKPGYGNFALWLRVLSIARDEAGTSAVLSTRRSTAFTYSATLEATS